MSPNPIATVCVFGSTARQSTDCLSDRDVLVIASDRACRDQYVANWRRRGWSVASYTPMRLLKMIDAGSLFIQHLRTEGIILEDANGWLARQLAAARPKQSYFFDGQRSVFLALPLERLDEGAMVSERLIAADLAYVAVRNFGICHLADRERLSFDYNEIVGHLATDFALNKEEARLLEKLRKGKVAYRTKNGCPEIQYTVQQLRNLLSKFFVARPLRQIDVSTPIRHLDGGYGTLRDFETWAVCRIGHNCESLTELGEGMNRIVRLISEPRYYSWSVRNVDAVILEAARKLVENARASHGSGQSREGRGLTYPLGGPSIRI